MPPTNRASRKASASRAAARLAPARLLAAALQAQSQGVFIAARGNDPRGLTILFVNDSFCAMTGHSPADLVGQPHGILHTDRAEVERLRQWLGKAEPGRALQGEGFLVRRTGGSISVAWSFDPLFDAAGGLTHVVATYRDQTEKRRLQEALVHSQRMDAVGRLAGGVAHDFNNLVSVINGYCEILAAHVSANPEAMRDVAEIHLAGRKAAALTQQLLAFSRRQPLNSRILNLNTLVRENVEILRKLVGSAGRLEVELAEPLPNVRTDPAQFQQVLINLVLNARDALRDRGRIVVSTALTTIPPEQNGRATDTPPGRYVTLTVADNGTGMDVDTQKHLFEPFFTTKPEGRGTGLGLALVYGVVQQSGGSVAVRSSVLVGSTFEVRLPVCDESASAAPPAVTPLASLRGNESILLVEGDELVRKMVMGILTADGYRVTAVGSFAEAALEPPPPRPFQLLIAALDADGEKSARRLFKANPALRLLCTCQSEESKGVLGGMKPGHQIRLNKPYALSELLRATRKLLDT